ncbi:hypothetical protein CPU12_01985 [Malaciobacter molluscorum LMG 25693]|uniref:Thioredoxin family protein n=1 Tax=Malaciobacter molluscorum LMG 25693 TaxID=870501 RepID=A0A2G1DKQ2_9BACT|nr:hypothetical protein [Malaciobacter molluscorum]AXX92615.1 hypothetical protein AMOL_1650 [Malaciobacter molluscorum LMG 25693]PHO19040.1 hypothetical protein CPU12_01985 [Malaciobacter molluscorum LMG 25693]
MLKNVLKLVVLGIIAFAAIVYFTANEPVTKVNVDTSSIKLSNLPASFEIVGKDKNVSKDSLFKMGSKTLIIVGNHDSLSVVKDLPKFYDLKIPYVMVANISAAPWFVKKMFIPSKLEELNKGSNIPMIYDFDGNMVNALGVTDNAKTSYIAYLVDENGNISQIAKGSVKEGALDGSMNDEEKKESLLPLEKYLK